MCPPTGGRQLRALERVNAGSGATSYPAAIDAAASLVGSREGRVVVVTDLQRSGWDAGGESVVPTNVTIEVRDVDPTGENLAVLAVRRGPAGVVGAVLNTSAMIRATTATLRIDDDEAASAEWTLAPGTTEVVFDVPLPSTGVLELAIDDPDGLAADDRRYALLDPPLPTGVTVVGPTVGGLEPERSISTEPSPRAVAPARSRYARLIPVRWRRSR